MRVISQARAARLIGASACHPGKRNSGRSGDVPGNHEAATAGSASHARRRYLCRNICQQCYHYAAGGTSLSRRAIVCP